MSVRLYNRKDNRETEQWYAVSAAEDGVARFDGQRLRIAGLTATYDRNAARWISTWTIDGQRREVMLERPQPASGVSKNPLCGDWEALPDGSQGSPSLRIHVAQSTDGTLAAWMDVSTVVREETYGIPLEVISSNAANVVLQNETPSYQVRSRFTGLLSQDRNTLTGHWNERPAVQIFRRTAS
jgi:hypothetical protein